MASILYSVKVPGFDRTTGQLSLAEHDLVSISRGYASHFSRRCTLAFEPAPARPYDDDDCDDDNTRAHKNKKKKRRAPDGRVARANKRSTTELESDQHHRQVALHLEGAVDAVRQGWRTTCDGIVGWDGSELELGGGRGRDATRRRAKTNRVEKESNTNELDLVDLVNESTDRDDDDYDGVIKELELRPDGTNVAIALQDLAGSIHVNSTNRQAVVPVVDIDEANPTPFRIVVPPQSGFYLTNFGASWTDPRGAISTLARKIGGWDLVILESVRSKTRRGGGSKKKRLGSNPIALSLSLSLSIVRPGRTLQLHDLPSMKRSTRTTCGSSTFRLCSRIRENLSSSRSGSRTESR